MRPRKTAKFELTDLSFMRSAAGEGVNESKQILPSSHQIWRSGPFPHALHHCAAATNDRLRTSWSFVSVERFDPSDRFVLGHS